MPFVALPRPVEWMKILLENYFNMELKQTPYKQPWGNGKVERFHRSLKEEALADIIPISQHQVHRLCQQYKTYYNDYRCHQGLGGRIPNRESFNLNEISSRFKKLNHLNGKIVTFEPALSLAASFISITVIRYLRKTDNYLGLHQVSGRF
jgi:hypothetical protein